MKTKILAVIVLLLTNILIFNFSFVQADSSIGDVISGGDSFLNAGKQSQSTEIDYGELKSTSSDMYNILLIMGVIVAVIVAGILGIKFMLGSVEEKAQIKDAMIPFIIGCVIIFGAFGFWKIFVDIGNSFEDTQATQQTTQTKNVRKCKSCKKELTQKEINEGKCSRCGSGISPEKCKSCKKELTQEEINNGKCSRCGSGINL